MKTTHRITLGVALLAIASVFIWKDSIPFLSSSVIMELPPTTHSQSLRIQVDPRIGQKAYNTKVLEAIIKEQNPGCTKIDLDTAFSEDVLQVFFTCHDNLVTTEFIPETTIPQTTSPGLTEDIVTTEISASSDFQ